MIATSSISFEESYLRVAKDERLQLPRSRAEGLWNAALSCLLLEGEYWECGVFKGGSAAMLADVLRARPRPLRLFDTFRGFSGVSRMDREEVKEGRMWYSDEAVQDVTAFVNADFASIHPGPIPSGFAGLEGARIAFANLDVDLYKPTRDALAFILPRMAKGGIVVVDDYNDPDWPGVTSAINELGIGAFSFDTNGTQARIRL